MRLPILPAALAVLGAAAAPAAARADTAGDYNLFVLGNMIAQGSDTQGRVAVGGNASLTSYSVGDDASASGVNLVVGGNLTTNGGSTKGKMVVGGASSFSSYNSSGLQPAGTAAPVDFGAEAIRLTELSKTLAGYTSNGAVSTVNYGGSHGYQATLSGTDSTLNVFNLDGAIASKTNTFTIKITPGSTALINVSGSHDFLSNAGVTIVGGDASDILWNFSDATTLGFYSIGMMGSVLAPNADYNPGGWGVINGQLIVKSFTGSWSSGSTQVNDVKYAGGLLQPTAGGSSPAAIPEPGVWMLMIGGFGALGVALRRKRRSQARSTGAAAPAAQP